jgi:hypothetical protein
VGAIDARRVPARVAPDTAALQGRHFLDDAAAEVVTREIREAFGGAVESPLVVWTHFDPFRLHGPVTVTMQTSEYMWCARRSFNNTSTTRFP